MSAEDPGTIANLQAFVSALLAGVGVFLAVTIAATELSAAYVGVSLIVGLPAGLLAGFVVAGGLYVSRTRVRQSLHHRLAVGVITGSAVFVFVYLVLLRLADVTLDVAIPAALAGGVVVGIAFAMRGRESR